MIFSFIKYQGTGNDFVIVDNRDSSFPIKEHALIAQLCHRNYGIGADGFIAIESDTTSDFFMRYFNADGHEGSLCGNGSRCAVHYANALGLTQKEVVFRAADGLHQAQFVGEEVALSLHDVSNWETRDKALFIDTGSPHHIAFVVDVSAVDVATTGAAIAHGAPYYAGGTNVNFVEVTAADGLSVRTFERGVEAETLSCGTGVTAAAIGAHLSRRVAAEKISIHTKGGILTVSFTATSNGYKAVVLQGPATPVYKGQWEITTK
jgi:diaminopimelate epimerase